jgi:lactate racemase
MLINLDYGEAFLPVDLPHDCTVIEPRFRPPASNPERILRAALQTPIGKPPIRELVRPGQRIGISVCDITRAQPRQTMLQALFAEIPGIRLGDVTIFIATGTHRRNTDREIAQMIGEEYARCCRVVCHDARETESLVDLGRTENGVPILLNRDWVESDVKITTGFVEPHFFAGFSGGPKMVAPGLAGLDTVLELHNVARIAHPKATWGITIGNPIHDDVREIAQKTGVDFALDVTLNRNQEITSAYAGDLLQEHSAACATAMQDAMRPVDSPFDVVVTTNSGYPLDQNLYQAVKGMSAAAKIVKPGGTIICAAECRDGIPEHGAYREILASRSSPQALLEMITAPGYSRPDQWQVQIHAQIRLKAQVWLKSGYLSEEQVRAAHLTPVEDISTAVADALRDAGPASSLCVLPHGPQTIPYVK